MNEALIVVYIILSHQNGRLIVRTLKNERPYSKMSSNYVEIGYTN